MAIGSLRFNPTEACAPLVNQQLQRLESDSGRKEERLVPTKNSKGRQITPAPFVMDALRHSYAVAAIRAGDDIKTVQGNLGHATAAFTLDVYGHVTGQMKQASAARMESFIQRVSGQ